MMNSKERIEYANAMASRFNISSNDYMLLLKGNDIEQLEDRIQALQEYLLYKKLNVICDYSDESGGGFREKK